MDEQHVFVSDVHLGAFSSSINDKIEQDLIALIRFCESESYRLYVLGDLFDYWMEYPKQNYVPDLGNKVLDAFEHYNGSVQPALYITGNHDNWTFGHFKERGFEVEPNFREINIGEEKLLLMHGDGLESDQIQFPRPALHRLLRNKNFIRFYQLLLPPSVGLPAMKLFSSITRKRNKIDAKPLNLQTEKILKQQNIDYVVSGHDHIPRVETFSGGTYINLGTFFNHRSVGLYNNKGMNVVTWQAESKIFLPLDRIKENI